MGEADMSVSKRAAMAGKRTRGGGPCAPAAVFAGLLLATGTCGAQTAAAPSACGEIGMTRGDYISDRRLLKTVEDYHFTPQVESLVKGQSSAEIGADLNYTLRSFPNHHRALLALMRLSERERTPQVRGAEFSVECYFDRALRFRPDDTVARMLYATYLLKQKRPDEARAQLARTAQDAKEAPMTHFNLGLLYLEMKDHQAALEHAHKAQALGLKRPELVDKLKQAGHWREPAPAAPADAAASGSAPAASAP
jgi:tetratricopeptide (TPR) repeat protein